jgi:hypothetical protein
MNKKLLIGLGVLGVAGIAFYMWRKKQVEPSEKEKSDATGESENKTEGEAKSESNLDLVESKGDYRVHKEIPPVNYVHLNKSYYYSK